MYDIEKIQWKFVYIRCTNDSNTWKNSKSLNVQYRQNSVENCVHQMYRWSEYVEKLEFVKCMIS